MAATFSCNSFWYFSAPPFRFEHALNRTGGQFLHDAPFNDKVAFLIEIGKHLTIKALTCDTLVVILLSLTPPWLRCLPPDPSSPPASQHQHSLTGQCRWLAGPCLPLPGSAASLVSSSLEWSAAETCWRKKLCVCEKERERVCVYEEEGRGGAPQGKNQRTATRPPGGLRWWSDTGYLSTRGGWLSPGARCRRVNEVDAALLHLEGRTHGRGGRWGAAGWRVEEGGSRWGCMHTAAAAGREMRGQRCGAVRGSTELAPNMKPFFFLTVFLLWASLSCQAHSLRI